MNSPYFVPVIGLIAVLVVVYFVRESLRAVEQSGRWPFYAKRLLSNPEQIVYFRMVEALPEYVVLAQVSLSRILGVEKGNSAQAWNNRINRMSVDFVVCKKDSSVVVVVELDDATHARKSRQVADQKKDKALSDAGIKVVRWPVKKMPDAAAIADVVAGLAIKPD